MPMVVCWVGGDRDKISITVNQSRTKYRSLPGANIDNNLALIINVTSSPPIPGWELYVGRQLVVLNTQAKQNLFIHSYAPTSRESPPTPGGRSYTTINIFFSPSLLRWIR